MQRPELIHSILSKLLQSINYIVSFKTVTNNGDNTYTLNDVCDFHHVQPSFGSTAYPLTIQGNTYYVVDYNEDLKQLIVRGANNTNTITDKQFSLYQPYFFHGTPVQQENEFGIKGVPNDKTPMVYLMEPFTTENIYDPRSPIERKMKFTLCFLSQSNYDDWTTDNFYHNTIEPMKRLSEDVLYVMRKSKYISELTFKASPVYQARFGIYTKDGLGKKSELFTQWLSGVSVDVYAEIYLISSCGCGELSKFLRTDMNEFIAVD